MRYDFQELRDTGVRKEDQIIVGKTKVYYKENTPYIKAPIYLDVPLSIFNDILSHAKAQVNPEKELRETQARRRWVRVGKLRLEKVVPFEDEQAKEIAKKQEATLEELQKLFSRFGSNEIYDEIRKTPDLAFSNRKLMQRFLNGNILHSTEPQRKMFKAFESRLRFAVQKIEKEEHQKFLSRRILDEKEDRYEKVHYMQKGQSALSIPVEVKSGDSRLTKIQLRRTDEDNPVNNWIQNQ